MRNTKAVCETWGLFNHIFTEGAFQKEKTLSHSSLTNRKVARYWSLGQNPALFEKGLESSLNVSPMMLGQAQDIRIKPIANSQSSQLLEHYIPCQTMSKYSFCLHQLTMVPVMFAYGFYNFTGTRLPFVQVSLRSLPSCASSCNRVPAKHRRTPEALVSFPREQSLTLMGGTTMYFKIPLASKWNATYFWSKTCSSGHARVKTDLQTNYINLGKCVQTHFRWPCRHFDRIAATCATIWHDVFYWSCHNSPRVILHTVSFDQSPWSWA